MKSSPADHPADPPAGPPAARPAAATLRRPPGWLDPQTLRDAGVLVGERVRVAEDVVIDRPDLLELADDVEIHPGVRLMAEGGITIRERSIVSAGAQVLSVAPSIPRRGRRVSEAAPDRAQVEIGPDVWIGHAAVVMPGARIESDVVVLPGSVVKGHVALLKVVAGNPAMHHHNRSLF